MAPGSEAAVHSGKGGAVARVEQPVVAGTQKRQLQEARHSVRKWHWAFRGHPEWPNASWPHSPKCFTTSGSNAPSWGTCPYK